MCKFEDLSLISIKTDLKDTHLNISKNDFAIEQTQYLDVQNIFPPEAQLSLLPIGLSPFQTEPIHAEDSEGFQE